MATAFGVLGTLYFGALIVNAWGSDHAPGAKAALTVIAGLGAAWCAYMGLRAPAIGVVVTPGLPAFMVRSLLRSRVVR